MTRKFLLPPIILLGATSALAAPPPSAGITVEGVCNRRAVADRGALTITADVLEKDLQTAVQKATASYERVRAAVKKLPLENLEVETSEYSVYEDKQWEKDRLVSKGFRARMGLRVTSSSISKLGEVAAIAAKEGIRDVGAMSTSLSPAKLKAEQMECLEEAARHARAKADKLAAALGAKVGALVAISEILPPPTQPVMPLRMAKSAEMAADTAPGIEAGRQDLSITVYATFSLRQ